MNKITAATILVLLLAVTPATACTFEDAQEKASQLAYHMRHLAKVHQVRYHEILEEMGQLSISDSDPTQRAALCRHYDRLVWAARHPFSPVIVGTSRW